MSFICIFSAWSKTGQASYLERGILSFYSGGFAKNRFLGLTIFYERGLGMVNASGGL